MFSAGRYVRAPPSSPESDSAESHNEAASVGRFVRAPCVEDPDAELDVDDGYAALPTPGQDYQKDLEAKVLELKNAIEKIKGTLDATRAARVESSAEEVSSPCIPFLAPSVASTEAPSVPSTDPKPVPPSNPPFSGSSIRWDNIKPFPKNVAATKMWEAWTRFLEDFETAASLSNLWDPKRRVELLLLSMGDELKSIVRAAKLRPSEEEGVNSYNKFVENIDQYLKAMTDPAAEHEDFSKMFQEEGEPAVKFYARLTEKVILCGYSPADQDRFVRNQLLRGLRSHELKKAARTYGHDANTIVHAATRAEAFQEEMAAAGGESSVLAVSGGKFQRTEGQVKRKQVFHQSARDSAKRFKSDFVPSFQQRSRVSRRNRCSRCFRQSHGSQECPALRRNCNACGQRGHFAAACREDRLSMVKDEGFETAVNDSRTEQVKK